MLGVERIGRYEVLGHLASGGMGQVYLAKHTGLGGFERRVVVKTLDVADDEDQFVTMFLDEARLVGALHHQYIAPVYEVGQDADGRYYIVMDYIDGETAEAVFRRSSEGELPAIPLGFALSVVYAIASALDYAHKLCAPDGMPLQIVHRDVSLSNVMIGYQGGVKLIDFGIAKSANRATKTLAGALKGKFGYLSPEQVLRGAVDHRTDVFALGIILYELTTMKRAFVGSSELITLERITKSEYTPPSEHVADYPQALAAIVEQALALEPERRFQSAGEMAHEIEALARASGIALGDSAIVGPMEALAQVLATRTSQRFARSSKQVRTERELFAKIEAEAAAREDLTPVVAMKGMPLLLAVLEIPEHVDDDLTVPVASPGAVRVIESGISKLPSRARYAPGLVWTLLALLAVVVGAVAAIVVR
ncbi:hypothetical protein BH11MYX1_BH11MYX1_16860 [soil metagenome]